MDRVSTWTKLTYSIGSVGTGIYLTVPSVLLLYYLSDVLGVPPALAGAAVFVPRIWDVVTDPVMGWISDRTRSPWGRRSPYLLLGALLVCGSFIFLFSAPHFAEPVSSFVYVLVVYILSATAYTIFAVPYIAMPAEMSTNPHERSSIMAFRMTFAMIGILAGSAAAPALVDAFGGDRAGFRGMSFVLGALCGISMLLTFLGTRKIKLKAFTESSIPLVHGVVLAFRVRHFKALAVTYILQLAAMGVFTAIAPYFVKEVMKSDESALTNLFLALLVGTLLTLLVWSELGKRIGKVRAYFAAAVLLVCALAFIWFSRSAADWNLLYGAIFIVGVGFAGLQLLPFAMLTDLINAELHNERDIGGLMTGVWTALEKGGLALGPLVVGIALSAASYQAGAGAQPESAVVGVRLLFSLAPAGLALISLASLALYRDPVHEAAE
ncbi:MAG: MFS transporter [Hyphomonas sp.]